MPSDLEEILWSLLAIVIVALIFRKAIKIAGQLFMAASENRWENFVVWNFSRKIDQQEKLERKEVNERWRNVDFLRVEKSIDELNAEIRHLENENKELHEALDKAFEQQEKSDSLFGEFCNAWNELDETGRKHLKEYNKRIWKLMRKHFSF